MRTRTSGSDVPSTTIPNVEDAAGRFCGRRLGVSSCSGEMTSAVFRRPMSFVTTWLTWILPPPIAT